MSTAALTATHARFQFLELIRVPITILSVTLFPLLGLLFFVVPFGEIAGDPVAATEATAQMIFFGTMSAFLFIFGAQVAEDRALPWDSYVRTLPVGAVPRIGGRVLNGLLFSLISLVPVSAAAALFTAATVSVTEAALGLLALFVGTLPMLFLGLAIGYAVPQRAAVALAQILLFFFAFAGGLFLPPMMFPTWLNSISQFIPSRAGRDLLAGALTGQEISARTILTLLAWLVLTAALAVFAYRRDEVTRYR